MDEIHILRQMDFSWKILFTFNYVILPKANFDNSETYQVKLWKISQILTTKLARAIQDF